MPYDPATMAPLAALAYDWYLAESQGRDDTAKSAFLAEIETLSVA